MCKEAYVGPPSASLMANEPYLLDKLRCAVYETFEDVVQGLVDEVHNGICVDDDDVGDYCGEHVEGEWVDWGPTEVDPSEYAFEAVGSCAFRDMCATHACTVAEGRACLSNIVKKHC